MKRPESKMIKLTINIDSDLHKRFKRLACELGLPMGVLIHNLMEGHLAKYEYLTGKRRVA
jgi:hypothetical protein